MKRLFKKKRLIKAYTLNNEFVGIFKTVEMYDGTFYHKMMPVLPKRTCSKIIKELHHNYISYATLYLEWVDTGKGQIQRIWKKDMIISW